MLIKLLCHHLCYASITIGNCNIDEGERLIIVVRPYAKANASDKSAVNVSNKHLNVRFLVVETKTTMHVIHAQVVETNNLSTSVGGIPIGQMEHLLFCEGCQFISIEDFELHVLDIDFREEMRLEEFYDITLPVHSIPSLSSKEALASIR